MMEIEKIHFVLPAGVIRINSHSSEVNNIKIWALSNPSKKIVIWYDSLANLTKIFFDKISEVPLNYGLLNDNKLIDMYDKTKIKYLAELGGASLFKNLIELYIQKFPDFFVTHLALATDPRFSDPNQFIENFNNQLNQLISDNNFTEQKFKNNIEGIFGTRKLDFEGMEFLDTYREKDSIKEYIIKNLPDSVQGNIEVRDFYNDFPNLFQHKLYPLYLYECLCNRSLTLAQNLFIYILASQNKNQLVMIPRLLPKLRNDILTDKSLETEAVLLALKKLQSENILFKELVPKYSLNQEPRFQELENRIKSVSNEALFTPIEQPLPYPIYASFNEENGMVQYFMLPKNIQENLIDEYMETIFKKRFKQIEFLPLHNIESLIYDKIIEHFRIEDKQENIPTLRVIKGIIDGFRKRVYQHYQTSNEEYVRHLASRFSYYERPISEATGPIFWSNIKLDKLHSINTTMLLAVSYNSQEKMLLDTMHENRMRSNFDLDIFIYIHQENTEYLGFTRYPSYNKKGILFTYKQGKIQFKESGIIVESSQGLRPLEATEIKKYIDNNFRGKKIRIQISGHSAPDYEIRDGNVVAVEQTVGGLRVQKFTDLFNEWLSENVPDVSVDRLVFVSCNLVHFKDTNINAFDSLPKDSFLDIFVNTINERGIRIKQITASDGTVFNVPETGRLFRSQRDPQTGEEISAYRSQSQEVRKVIINIEKLDAEMRDPDAYEAMDHSHRLTYRCKAILFSKNVSAAQVMSNNFSFSQNVFDASDLIKHPEVLEVNSEVASISNEADKVNRANRGGHRIVGPDAMALICSMQNNTGNVFIIGTISVKIEAIRLSLRMAVVFNDHMLWKTFLKSYFPQAYKHLESFINQENFNNLVGNIFSAKIVFANGDLTKVDAYRSLQNFLEIETGHSIIDFIYASDQENDISRIVLTQNMERSFSSDDAFALEKLFILKREQQALSEFRKNLNALMQDDTLLIRNEIKVSDRGFKVSSNEHLQLLGREVSYAESFAATYHMAKEFRNVFQGLVESRKVLAHYIPLLDTMEVETLILEGGKSQKYWTLFFMNSKKIEVDTIKIRTKESIFERVSNYVKNSAVNHLNVAGSSALNLIFGVQALCRWVENGFKIDTEGISNKSLATAIEVHFYVNAVGLMQGLGETSVALGSFAANQTIKSALQIKALKPFVQMSLFFSKTSTAGRFLLSMGRFASKALPVLSFFINAADLVLNAYELSQNNDPYQRPTLITNTVFSSVGIVVSTAAIVASILAGSAVAGPLGLIGLGVAVIYIPISYLVSTFTERVENAKHIGSVIKSIVGEIKYGAYRKIVDGKFLAAPSLMAVKELNLSSSEVKVGFGKANYYPTSTQYNWFTNWYQAEGEYAIEGDGNHAKIPIDNNYRTLVMPHIPGYNFTIIDEKVPFSGFRNDAEFDVAKDLQKKDPGFDFQHRAAWFGDQIASKFTFDYVQTDIDIQIVEESWKLIFPWGDPAQAGNENDKKNLKDSNSEIAKYLEKIRYHINAENPGRQSIVLPGKECPLDLFLTSSHEEVSWFVSLPANSRRINPIHPLSNYITIKQDNKENNITNIKIGEKQNIEVNGMDSKLYLIIPIYAIFGYENYDEQRSTTAYLEVGKKYNRYIYTFDFTSEEKDTAILILSTHEYAYFYVPKQGQGVNISDGTLVCVRIKTKKVVSKHSSVKTFEKQGEGLLFVDTQGVIYHLGEDLKSQELVSNVVGFNGDWFNQRQNPLNALDDIDIFLKKNFYSPVMHLYLPYYSDDQMLQGNIVYYRDKNKYFILDVHYANANFLKFDAFDLSAYFFSNEDKNIISVNGIDKEKASEKLQMYQGKIQIKSEETYEILLKNVLKAFVAENGIRVHISCGLVLLIYKEEYDDPTGRINIKVEKFVLNEDFENGPDRNTHDILQEILSTLEMEHLGESFKGRTQIFQAGFVAIESKGKNIGFYESISKRTLSIAKLPTAQYITPLGSDGLYAYDILDNKHIYQSEWVTHLSEIKNGPKTLIHPPKLFFDAEALELYDNTLFIKKDFMPEDFSNVLVTLSKLPELEVIWIESKVYNLELDPFENIALSSVDLSKDDPTTNIHLQIKAFEGYVLLRENFDLCLYHLERNFSFFIKGIFKLETPENSFYIEGVKSGVFDIPDTICLSSIISRYNQNQEVVNINGKIFYPKVTLLEILEMRELSEELLCTKNVWYNVIALKKHFDLDLKVKIVNIHDKTIFFQSNGRVDVYDCNTGQWSEHAIPEKRDDIQVVVIGIKVIFYGGLGNYLTVHIYDSFANTWSQTITSEAIITASVAIVGQRAIFAGKIGANAPFTDIDIYDSETGMWTIRKCRRTEARYNALVAVVGNKAIFFGGLDYYRNTRSDMYIYYNKENTWKQVKQEGYVPKYRWGSSVAVIGSKVIFFGGKDDYGFVSYIDIYYSKENVWTKVEQGGYIPEARIQSAVAVIGRKAIFFGGFGNSSAVSSAIDIYDSVANKWSQTKSSKSHIHVSVAVIGQKAIFFSFTNTFSAVDIYDDKTGQWGSFSVDIQLIKSVVVVNSNKATFIGYDKNGNAQACVVKIPYRLEE